VPSSLHEQERLLLHVAAGLAQQRRDRGLKLNYPESVALISAWVLEEAPDGTKLITVHGPIQ
jgi:urease subunit gamma